MMTRTPIQRLPSPCLLAVAAGAALGAGTNEPSPLIYPAETIPLAFDHAQHARLGATCQAAHQTAQTSTSAADNLIPREAACRACHKIDRTQPTKSVPQGQGAARCDACHVGWTGTVEASPNAPPKPPAEPPRVVLARPNLKFNHKLHAMRGIGCALCHTNVDTQQAPVTRADLPMMASCLGCHDGKQATARCSACHLTEPDGRLKTKLVSAATMAAGATGPLTPSGSLRGGIDAHTATFKREHKQAGREESYCLTCHKRNECIDCHGGVVRPPEIHPSDYASLHAIDARRNTPDCSACHRTRRSILCGVPPAFGGGTRSRGGTTGVKGRVRYLSEKKQLSGQLSVFLPPFCIPRCKRAQA